MMKNDATQVDPSWSSTLRQAALSLILLRAGLAMDLGALKRLRYVVGKNQ